MSDEPLVGEAAEQAAHGYVPMGEVTAPEPEPASGDGPLTEWTKRREAEGEARHTTERNYVQIGGENAGEPAPDNQTLSIERATRDLTNVRAWEGQQAQAEVDQRLAAEVDSLRAPFAAAQAPEQQQDQQQEQQAPQIESQPETPQQVAGADPDLVRVISENPKLAEALQAEMAKVEAAQQAYQNGLQTNAAAALAAVLSEFPEVQNAAPHEFPTVVKVLAETNPQRAQALASKLNAVNALVGQFQQEAAQQRQRLEAQYRQQWAEWSKTQDDLFEKAVPEATDPRAVADLGRAAVSMLRSVGFSDDDVIRAWHGQASLSLRDYRAQVILLKAALYDEAQKTAPQKAHRAIPPVQRPGVSRDRSDYAEDQLASLRQRLSRTGDVKDAARLVLAQRAARGG